jgi:redox-sensitive bicupin YhaK (pirin superfamily)
MITIRKASERGHANHGWLDSYHTFSFGTYRDPQHTRFRTLRVMNEDRVAPGQGFGTHPHDNMEIITYVLSGALEHRDSLGNGEVIRPGELQRMSAGTGITHSEFNPSETEPVHLYQIWLFPKTKGVEPSYEQRDFSQSRQPNQWQLVASPDGADASLTINQEAQIFLATLQEGKELHQKILPQRHAWLQVLRGAVRLNGQELTAGDGAAVSEESKLTIEATTESEIMLFNLS